MEFSKEQIDGINSAAKEITEYFGDTLKLIEGISLTSAVIEEKTGEEYLTLVTTVNAAYTLATVNKKYNFNGIEAVATSTTGLKLSGFEFGKVHAIEFNGKGTLIYNKSNTTLNFAKDLTKQEQSFVFFFAITLAGMYQFADKKEVANKLKDQFEKNARSKVENSNHYNNRQESIIKESFNESFHVAKKMAENGGILGNETGDEYARLIKSVHAGIVISDEKEIDFDGIKVKLLNRNRVTIDNINFGNINKAVAEKKGTVIFNKNGNILGIEDLNNNEKAFAFFITASTVSFFNQEATEDFAKAVEDKFVQLANIERSNLSDFLEALENSDHSENKEIDFEKEALEALRNIKNKMGVSEPEGLKDTDEFPLQAHSMFCDVMDKKITSNIQNILSNYVYSIIAAQRILRKIDNNIPFGWSNLFFIKSDEGIVILGDFKSRFNTIINPNTDNILGLFSFDGVMPLAPNATYNEAKVSLFCFIWKIASENIDDERQVKIEALTRAATTILNNNSYSADTTQTKPFHRFNIQKINLTFENEKEEQPKENLDEKAFELMFNSTSPAQISSNEYLLWAVVEAVRDSLQERTMAFLTSMSMSYDKHKNIYRLVFNNNEDIVFVLHADEVSFYVQDKKTLEKYQIRDLEEDKEEQRKARIVNLFLHAVAGLHDQRQYFGYLKNHLKK